MDLKLKRYSYSSQGIFGVLLDVYGDIVCFTLEHSYNNKPKLVDGVYDCIRGNHRLGFNPPFETFEITGVPGHTGILFHCGNTEEDSSGCVLVGSSVVGSSLTESRVAFEKLMELEAGLSRFKLSVG